MRQEREGRIGVGVRGEKGGGSKGSSKGKVRGAGGGGGREREAGGNVEDGEELGRTLEELAGEGPVETGTGLLRVSKCLMNAARCSQDGTKVHLCSQSRATCADEWRSRVEIYRTCVTIKTVIHLCHI